MKESFDLVSDARCSERGAARAKFIITLAVVAVLIYMGIQYIPVAYQAYQFGKAIDDKTDLASAGGKPPEWLKQQIKSSVKDYSTVPEDVNIGDPILRDGRMEVTVKFTRPVSLLPFWTYNYSFEHTAKSSTFNTH